MLTIPIEMWFRAAVADALTSMTLDENWQQVGTVDIGSAVDAASKMFNSWSVMIGMIVPYAGETVPDGMLVCDGAAYDISLYPSLHAVIGTAFGAGGTGTFRVPDLRGRGAIGDGTGSGLSERTRGDSLGEETHTLSTGEMPTHSHSISGTFPGVAVSPGELPVLTPSIIGSLTGDTGSGGAHNNMQPSLVIKYLIVAG